MKVSVGINGRVLTGVENQEYRNYYDISQGMITVSYPAYTIWRLSAVQRIGRNGKRKYLFRINIFPPDLHYIWKYVVLLHEN